MKKWAIGFVLGALCASLWAAVDLAFFGLAPMEVYIAVMCAYAAGHVTAY